jgi:hypothetical protein
MACEKRPVRHKPHLVWINAPRGPIVYLWNALTRGTFFSFIEVRDAASNSANYGYPELWILRYPALRYHAVPSPGFEPTTLWLRVRYPIHSATTLLWLWVIPPGPIIRGTPLIVSDPVTRGISHLVLKWEKITFTFVQVKNTHVYTFSWWTSRT